MVKRFGQGEVTAEEVGTQILGYLHDEAVREKEKEEADSLEGVSFDYLDEKVKLAAAELEEVLEPSGVLDLFGNLMDALTELKCHSYWEIHSPDHSPEWVIETESPRGAIVISGSQKSNVVSYD